MRCLLSLVVLCFFSGLLFSSVSLADETEGCRGGGGGPVYVENSNDSGAGSLREALQTGVCGGLTVKFLQDVHVVLESELALNTGSSGIYAEGHDVVIDGNGHSVFSVLANQRLILGGLKVIDAEDGAIENQGELFVNGVTFSGNSNNSGSGGAINNAAELTIENSTFNGNSASIGGAIYNESSGMISMNNVSFYENAASAYGLTLFNKGSIVADHITIYKSSGTGISLDNETNLTLRNSIISGMTSGSSECGNIGGTLNLTNNLIDSGNCGGDINGDPILSDLTDNGGPTMTMALGYGSAAVNTADAQYCGDFDQRGERRNQYGACDLGAFELDSAPVLYVDVNVSAVNRDNQANSGLCDPGECWALAYDNLQDALAVPGVFDVRVADGIYYPDVGNTQTNDDLTSSFSIPATHKIYGGFAGNDNEALPADPESYKSILSGDIDENDNDSNADGIIDSTEDLVGINALHVITAVDPSLFLEGVYVTAGMATGLPEQVSQIQGNADPDKNNAAIQGDGLTMALNQVGFYGNLAEEGGGVTKDCFYLYASDLTVVGNKAGTGLAGGISCPNSYIEKGLFENNRTDYLAGAFYGGGELIDVSFFNNHAGEGGGAVVLHNDSVLERNTFIGNQSLLKAGAIFVRSDNVFVKNSLFLHNKAIDGGAFLSGASNHSLEVHHSTVSGNEANNGSGIYMLQGDLTVLNSIIWHNNELSSGTGTLSSAVKVGAVGINYNGSFAHNLIQGSGGSTTWDTGLGMDHGGNIDSDPLFVSVPQIGVINSGDVNLSHNSPAIAQGEANFIEGDSFDLNGVDRLADGFVDMGAFESTDLIFMNGLD